MKKAKVISSPLFRQIEVLDSLLKRLLKASNLEEKLRILDAEAIVKQYLSDNSLLSSILKELSLLQQFAIKSVIAIGQGPQVFGKIDEIHDAKERLKVLLTSLEELEKVYDVIGGIIGYHLTMIKLIVEKENPQIDKLPEGVSYHKPEGINLAEDSPDVRESILWGIESMSHVAVIYPVGGAGDRLDLHDEHSGEPLPAAALAFLGRSLLEVLIRDLQGREYLYYKITGKQLKTPIAMMTSHEKNNHKHITKICTDKHWFGRSPESFNLFIQPLVPVVTINGDWVTVAPLQLMLKPGGHGVIWKLAKDQGVLDWLISKGFRHALVRQINNPVAGTDYGLCAFIGWGFHHKKAFGFASCPRLLKTAEGMDVLIETETKKGFEYRISNIEYTEFEHKGVQDVPEFPGSRYSLYPANTNILFVDVEVIKKTVSLCPIPGMLINMKSSVSYTDPNGQTKEVKAGRLESMMQNIADYIVDLFPNRLKKIEPDSFRSYLTYNDRLRTISVAKKAYAPGAPFLETQEGCFYEVLHNNCDLLSRWCHWQTPKLQSEEEYLRDGPACIVLYHPALGPFYSVIAQKIQFGSIAVGSELQLEIAEVDLQYVELQGSLLIHADDVLGKEDEKGTIEYSEQSGKCTLHHVVIKNRGVNKKADNVFWKNKIERHESMTITLHGNAEFYAKNVTFNGEQKIEVPHGHRMIAYSNNSEVQFKLEKIDQPTWFWQYTVNEEKNIVLRRVE
jgi:UTP---glucose-1-phosphate uridylyltransferase